MYGSHDAPLIRTPTLAKAMIKYPPLPLNVGECVFAQHARVKNEARPLSAHGGILAAIIHVHVDDIISWRDAPRRELFGKCVWDFDHGDYEYLAPGQS